MFCETFIEPFARRVHSSLVSPESANLPAAFGTIRELMCFAAVLGYEMDRYEPLDRAQGVEDIGINVFENNNSDDSIYTSSCAHRFDRRPQAELGS